MGERIAVFMPMTLPSWVNSGPPELPWLIGASTWMNWSYGTGADIAAHRRDDACGDRAAQAERIAHGDDPLAGLHVGRIAELDVRKRLVGIDLQHRDVGARVGADHLGGKLGAVVQRDGDRRASFTT